MHFMAKVTSAKGPAKAPGKAPAKASANAGGSKLAAAADLLPVALAAGAACACGVQRLRARAQGRAAMPMLFGWGLVRVASGSMEPALLPGTYVAVRRAAHYAPGDIVVYERGRDLVIHRVIDVGRRSLITQGDANPAPDAPVPLTRVLGKVALSN
jgi:signal peptidase I